MTSDSDSRPPAAAPDPAHRRRRLAAALLGLVLLLNLVPVWWGLPSYGTWAVDEIEPSQVLGPRPWSPKYPPLHRWILTVVYRGVDVADILTGGRLSHLEIYSAYFLAGRALSALMATATVALVYLCARRLGLGRPSGVLAAGAVALMPAFVYYARTGNLEAPYLFWFALSLLFFLRAWEGRRLGDHLLFAAAAALAVTTKDQAYALYLLSPWLLAGAVLRERKSKSGGGWPRALLATVSDRRIWLSALVAAAVFALVHNLLFDFEAFARHFRVITGHGTFRYRLFPATAAGHLEMAALALRHLIFLLSWPLAAAAGGGLALALAAPRANARLLALAGVAAAYYLGFIALLGYHYDRFLLAPALLLAFFAAHALERLLARLRLPAPAAAAVVAALLLFPLARAVGVGSAMLSDSRYAAEDWLRGRAAAEDVVGFGSRPMLPRGLRPLKWGWLIEDGCEFLAEESPAYIVVNRGDTRSLVEEAVFGRLERGGLGYEVALRARGRPALPPPSLDGVLSNLEKVNREIVVFGRGGGDCADVPPLAALAERLRDEPDPELAAALRAALLGGDIPDRIAYGENALAVGLFYDRWTRGDAAAALALRNESAAPALPRLRFGCEAPSRALPVPFVVDDGGEMRQAAFTSRGKMDLLLAPLAPGEERLVLFWAEKAWRPGGVDRRRLGVSLLEVHLESAAAGGP